MSAQSIVVPIIMSMFISIILAQPILLLEKKKVPYGLAILIVLVGVSILFLLFGGIIGNSFNSFLKNAPEYEAKLAVITESIIAFLNSNGANIDSEQLMNLLDPAKVLSFTAKAAGEVGSVVSNSMVIILITVFMLLEVKAFGRKTLLIQHLENSNYTYFAKITSSIRNYLSIKTVISFFTGLLIYIWLLILGVDYAILWGVIAFLLNYIPNIGSLLAAVPTVLLALVQLGPMSMLWTAIGYLVVNTVMGSIVEPKVMGKGLGLSTLVVFLSLIIWGFILGSVGLFLSIPLTMSLKIILEQNDQTKWLAILLGSEDETVKALKEKGLE